MKTLCTFHFFYPFSYPQRSLLRRRCFFIVNLLQFICQKKTAEKIASGHDFHTASKKRGRERAMHILRLKTCEFMISSQLSSHFANKIHIKLLYKGLRKNALPRLRESSALQAKRPPLLANLCACTTLLTYFLRTPFLSMDVIYMPPMPQKPFRRAA